MSSSPDGQANGVPGPPPGWYPDPEQKAAFRWWNGQQWTDQTATPQGANDWRSWMTGSRSARRVCVILASLGLGAAAITAAIIVADLIRQRPVPNVTALLVFGIPLVAAGQLWTIALMQARQPPRPRGWRAQLQQSFARQNLSFNPRVFFFGNLRPAIGRSLLALAFLGWLAAMTAIIFIVNGNPTGAGDGCAYRLVNHGTYSCVSHATYDRDGAGLQRFAAGILLGFYSVHAGAALGGLQQRPRKRSNA